ncbi:MAG: hypothetical protein KAT34_12790, partial [Candidatus Aminicenantes bacterium]|nr:hypothetical protein [Candidatus Aminicenantes bacterium]
MNVFYISQNRGTTASKYFILITALLFVFAAASFATELQQFRIHDIRFTFIDTDTPDKKKARKYELLLN